MHPGRLAAATERAHQRSMRAIATLGQRFGLAATAIPTTVGARRPEVTMLEQQEAVATLLEELVEKTGEHGSDGDQLAGLGLSPQVTDALIAAGLTTPAAIAAASDEQLLAIRGIGASTLTQIRAAVPAASSTPATDDAEAEESA